MLFFYVRHGDPVYDPDQLTPLGRRQAEALAKRLCLDTARRIGPYVDGYYIMTPFRRVELVKGIIAELKK